MEDVYFGANPTTRTSEMTPSLIAIETSIDHVAKVIVNKDGSS